MRGPPNKMDTIDVLFRVPKCAGMLSVASQLVTARMNTSYDHPQMHMAWQWLKYVYPCIQVWSGTWTRG